MKVRKKQESGITLVALVITIVLLILAGISIQALTNTGLFAQAEEAKKRTENAQKEEDEILKNYLEQMNAIIGGQVTEPIPDGATVTPVNDITTWLKTAEISKQYSYTTIEQVIADSACTESLMNNENAMKYLARSTEFADVICKSETAMTYFGESAYVDDTVLNSDTWVTAISSSDYWDLIYPSVTVHSSASATITVAGKTFTSDATGNTTHSMPWGTFSISDSVSKQSFECTIGRNTTDVYVMPESSLYWYGNLCGISWGYTRLPKTNYITYNTNSMYFSSNGTSDVAGNNSVRCYANSDKPIDMSYKNKLIFKVSYTFLSGDSDIHAGFGVEPLSGGTLSGERYVYTDRRGSCTNKNETIELDISSIQQVTDAYLYAYTYNAHISSGSSAYVYAIYLE